MYERMTMNGNSLKQKNQVLNPDVFLMVMSYGSSDCVLVK